MKKRSKMKKHFFTPQPQVRVTAHPIQSPQERQGIFMDLATSSEFDMRYRGLFEYYGKDMIAYKREKPSDQNLNEFLRVFSKFMTDCLEDNCPSSWKHCQPTFWEELIYTFYPHSMKISPDEKETEKFLEQLLKFVRWLDKRAGISWYPIVEDDALRAVNDLKQCERLLNSLFLIPFPRIHHDDWDHEQDHNKLVHHLEQCSKQMDGIFEVNGIVDDLVEVTELNSNRTYFFQGMPLENIVPGIILSGLVGKYRHTENWNWFLTEGVYPQRGKRFVTMMPPNIPVIKCVSLMEPSFEPR